ncbi:hypothetical protein Q9966_015808 [Columba livia]|nr:hypothetical protein Q9966_015808 [Columba livia]
MHNIIESYSICSTFTILAITYYKGDRAVRHGVVLLNSSGENWKVLFLPPPRLVRTCSLWPHLPPRQGAHPVPPGLYGGDSAPGH